MSVRHYCDICGGETDVPSQIEFEANRLQFKLLRAVDGVWNGGDVCIFCILKAIKQKLPVQAAN